MEEVSTSTGGVSRRTFLKTVGVAAAGAAAVGKEASAQEQPAGPEHRDGITRYRAAGHPVVLRVNGQDRSIHATPDTTLLGALREQLDLTGSKEVCGAGECGACTVLVNGRAVNSCLILAIDAVGSEVTTVEGLVQDGQLDPVQQAFADHDACQCGYCIPGFVVRSRALLDEQPSPDPEQIKQGLSGNVCRCAAYVRIFEAVAAASKGGSA